MSRPISQVYTNQWQQASLGSVEKLTLEERLLLLFARDCEQPETGATANYTLENCLKFARRTTPNFDQVVAGRTVLDFGCGPGFQSVAMRKLCGASFVFGLDAVDEWIPVAQQRAKTAGCDQQVRFGTHVPSELEGKFDVVLSLSAFEHYKDPASVLQQMRRQLKPQGLIILAFAEPWYSHSGSHVNNYTQIPLLKRPIPWLNLLFSDRAMLTLRSQFRNDRPQRLEDISGGLNRMTIARFGRIIAESGMLVINRSLFGTCNLPIVTKVPVLRELLTSSASCILQRQ